MLSSSPDSGLGMDVQGTLPRFSLSDDFVREEDNTTRGVTLDVSVIGCHHSDMRKFVGRSVGDESVQAKQSRSQSEAVQKVATNVFPSNTCTFAFFELDDAPTVPEDEFFQLQWTTIIAHGMSAAQVGNSVIHFLNKNVTSCITKVNRTKFTIKAEVILETLHCEVKACMYRQASREFCVELQRRGGDTIAFNRLFQMLAQHLNSYTASDSATAESFQGAMIEPFSCDMPHRAGASSETNVEPLLNLLELSRDKRLQADVVLILAHAARNIEVADQLCTPQVILLLRSLAEVLCFSIAEPLSRLVGCLATLPQAAALPEIQNLKCSLDGTSFA